MSIVALTVASVCLRISYVNLVTFMKLPNMLSKILKSVSSDGSDTFRMWNYLINRGVSAYLPPPGGAAAATNANFSICFQLNFGGLS